MKPITKFLRRRLNAYFDWQSNRRIANGFAILSKYTDETFTVHTSHGQVRCSTDRIPSDEDQARLHKLVWKIDERKGNDDHTCWVTDRNWF